MVVFLFCISFLFKIFLINLLCFGFIFVLLWYLWFFVDFVKVFVYFVVDLGCMEIWGVLVIWVVVDVGCFVIVFLMIVNLVYFFLFDLMMCVFVFVYFLYFVMFICWCCMFFCWCRWWIRGILGLLYVFVEVIFIWVYCLEGL